MPEVLIQAHSSALNVAFYDHQAFPAEYRGDAFVALHGQLTFASAGNGTSITSPAVVRLHGEGRHAAARP